MGESQPIVIPREDTCLLRLLNGGVNIGMRAKHGPVRGPGGSVGDGRGGGGSAGAIRQPGEALAQQVVEALRDGQGAVGLESAVPDGSRDLEGMVWIAERCANHTTDRGRRQSRRL